MGNRKILLVLNDLRIGGAETQALVLADYLKTRGWEPVILGLASPGPLQDRCREKGIQCVYSAFPYPWSRWYRPFYFLKMWWKLMRLRPRAVVAYTGVPNVLCGYTWRAAGVKACIWNQRSGAIARMPHHLEQGAARRISAFIANSRSGFDFLTGTLRVPADKVSLIPNGLELIERSPDSRRAVREKLGIDAGALVAAMIGNLREPKDQETLIRAWPAVMANAAGQGRSAVLLLAGRMFDEFASLPKLAESLVGEKAVRFLGYQSNVKELLSAVDVCVFSSNSEGLPNGVLESMAAGLPVVATDLPGIRSALPELQHWALVPAESPERFAEKIIAMSDPARTAECGAANRMRIEQEYSVDRMGRSMKAVLERSLQ
ncbi:MAG: glycosyltransferase family 4 protein [Kiritimatiellae bacterium]|nr:glycosyltransferase family 4 protein [Kiritimatiellia bacterium]